jgi:transposase
LLWVVGRAYGIGHAVTARVFGLLKLENLGDGVLSRRLLTRMLGIDPKQVRVLDAVAEELGGAPRLVVSLRPKARWQSRCGRCRARCPGYDGGRTRRWRAIDFGRTVVEISAAAPRVACPQHGVVVAAVPWARHDARHTYAFEQVAAWCAVEMSATAATRLLRCSWRTIGVMVARVLTDLQAASGSDGLDGLARIGIDEISYRRGHAYLVVVVDHDRRRLVWARPGRDQATVEAFFDALGERVKALTHISSDSAKWIARPIAARAGHAIHCADPFHVVRWAGDALDVIRRRIWNQVRIVRQRGRPALGAGKAMKRSLWALRKDPAGWTENQTASMAWIAATHPQLHRAWRLKEALRAVFADHGPAALHALHRWLSWARRARLPEFLDLARRITAHRATIEATLLSGLTNALTESLNTKIRLITRRAYGFKNVNALIALAQLSLGNHKPALPT